MRKVLICGRSGSGKSTFAEKLLMEINRNHPAEWLNGDEIREQAEDWDFSLEGRHRQCERIKRIADEAVIKDIITIADFICPTKELRALYDADMVIYMDSKPNGRYKDTDALFEEPTKEEYDFKLSVNDDLKKWSETLADLMWILV